MSSIHASSKEKISFFDLLFLDYGKRYADRHIKVTDCHQYLECTSSHSDQTNKSIVYCQALHLIKLCYLKKF